MAWRRLLAVGTVLLTLAGCGAKRQDVAQWSPPDPTGSAEATPEALLTPSAVPTSAVPTPKPTPATTKPAVKKTTKAATKPRVTPSTKPPAKDLPPPPPKPVPTTGANCPSFYAEKADLGTVRQALETAAATPFWDALPASRLPAELGGTAPRITVPTALMKAVAWQESGWKSTIVACDGGRGLMQVMPNTAPWMNQRFGTSHAIDSVQGNANLGAEYLEWLTLYFGLYYFGDFDLDTTAPVGSGGATLKLRDVVIAAYNVGYGGVENTDGTLGIPNKSYVNNVVALTTNCVCLSY